MPTLAPHLFPTYRMGSMVANTVDPFPPQNVLQNLMVLAINSTAPNANMLAVMYDERKKRPGGPYYHQNLSFEFQDA